jgi:hypothetical protein
MANLAQQLPPLHHFWTHDCFKDKWQKVAPSELAALRSSKQPRYITYFATTADESAAGAEYVGPFVVDIDVKEDQGGIAVAIEQVQKFAWKLTEFGVSLDQVSWFASGAKGFHAIVPVAVLKSGEFTAEERRNLPSIYHQLAMEIYVDGIDTAMYRARKGQMLREPNVRREDGRFKVPLTPTELLTMTPETYGEFTAGPRDIVPTAPPSLSPAFATLFATAAKKAVQQASKRPKSAKALTHDEIQELPDAKLLIEAVKRSALIQIDELLIRWLPGGLWQGDHYVVRNPMREDRNPGSFMIYQDGGYIDYACREQCSGGDLVALYAYLKGHGKSMHGAAEALAKELGLSADAELARIKNSAAVSVNDRPIDSRSLPARNAVITVQELLAKDFPPVRWVVKDVLPAGLTLFAAAPKTGKSWLAMDIAVCVGSGIPALGGRKTTQGAVLFLALEDNERRLKNRLTVVMNSRQALTPDLEAATGWDAIGAGGTTAVENWLIGHPNAALVVVDTLARVKPELKGNKDRYAQEYAAMSKLKALADRYNVAILVITHTRKQAGEDPMDSISGSNGLSGGVDNTWIMKKARGEKQAALFVIGRDIEDEINYGLQWDSDACVWSIQGTAAEVLANTARQTAMAAIRKSKTPLTVQDVALAIGHERSSTQRLLVGMYDDQLIKRTKAGRGFAYSF